MTSTTVNSVNDAPRGSDAAFSFFRNGSRVLSRADFDFADGAGEADHFLSVLLQLPSAGSLRLGGSVLSGPTEVTVAQLDAGDLLYAPTPGASGIAYSTLKFQVRDDGGTANGGVDLDPTQRTLSFDVINRAPTITSNGGGASVGIAIAENASVVTSVVASDADADAISYVISGGADAARFTIDSASGVLRFVMPPDFEQPGDVGADNIYNLTVQVSDGLLTHSQAIAVTVGNVNEALQTTNSQLVNTATGSIQETSMNGRGSTQAIAMAPAGDHVVVWSSQNQDGSGWGVYGQRYDNGGAAVGSEFRVNQFSTGDQKWATVAMAADGRFVVSWTSADQDGTAQSVYARLYGASGSAIGSEFRVNTTNTGSQFQSGVGMDANGNFVVVWQGNGPGDTDGIFARRFAADGSARDATDFRVNTDLARAHYDASVSMNASGAFVVTWDNNAGVQVRRYGSNGVALGGQINVDNGSGSGNGSVALANDGSFVTAWREVGLLDTDVYLRRYDAAGSAIGSKSLINSFTLLADQTSPSIAIDSVGNFIIAWEGSGSGDSSGVFAQKFNASGSPVGSEFRLNSATSGSQDMVSLAMLDLGNYAVVWSGQGPGDTAGVFTRRFGTLTHAPVITSNGGGSTAGVNVAENTTLVTTVTATDADLPAQTLVYSIAGGSDAGRFTINASTGVLRFVGAPDFETPLDGGADNVYDLTVQVSDGNLIAEQAIAVTVTPVNDNAPLITSHAGAANVNLSVSENTTAVTTITATDADRPAQTLTYSITGGADLGRFSINASTGVLRFTTAPNFEVPGDVGADNGYVVEVTASDGLLTGSQTFYVSVSNANDSPTGLPVISGSAIEDQTLSVSVAGIADQDGLGSLSYQWLRNGAAISGATGATLLLGDADVGQTHQRTGQLPTVAATTESPDQRGDRGRGQRQRCADRPADDHRQRDREPDAECGSLSGIADDDGLGAFSYQWLRNGIAISGATASTLLLGDADVGQAISVRVGYVDGHGTREALTSAATAAVINVNDLPTGLRRSAAARPRTRR